MLREVSGDILLTEAEVVAHGVAPNDNFASGLALSLRERWPAMYKDFRHYSQTFTPKPGELWSWAGVGGIRIVNLFTQAPAPSHGAKPGRATIENVNHSLKALAKLVETEKIKSLALPRLATGVGGLEWKNVKPLIERHLGHLSVPLYVYSTFHPDVKAKEAQV